MAFNEETSPDATTSSPSSTAPPAASPCQTADATPLVIPCCNICHSRLPIGRPATVNLCSKCYSEHLLKHEGGNLSRIERSPAALDMSTACVAIATEENGVQDLDYKLIPSPLSLSPPPVLEYEQEAQAPLLLSSPPPRLPTHQKVVNRCLACQKRVGLLGFKCKCGDLFCASHRYSDKHDCPFDYKAAGRAAIAKQNPLVVARKVEKI